MEAQLTKLMTLVDDIKDTIPEGKYLELCNTMKDAFEKKLYINEGNWKTINLNENNFAITYKPTSSDTHTIIIDKLYMTSSYPCKYAVHMRISHHENNPNAYTIIDKVDIEKLTQLLTREFTLNNANEITYKYPMDYTNKTDATFGHSKSITYTMLKTINSTIEEHELEKTIRKHQACDDDDDDGDDQFVEECMINPSSVFCRLIAYTIKKDISNYNSCLKY